MHNGSHLKDNAIAYLILSPMFGFPEWIWFTTASLECPTGEDGEVMVAIICFRA
jgi:hypothetical protein